VAWAKGVCDGAVILTACIRIANQQGNRRTGRFALVDARQNFDLIRLLALRHMTRGARTTTIEIDLDIGFSQRQSWWATVDHTANGWTMRLTKIRDAKQRTKGITRHSQPVKK